MVVVKSLMMEDLKKLAKKEGLKYVSDVKPGISRKKSGKGFSYRSSDGRIIKNEEELKRIRSIGVPPAYKNVWICPYPNGHIQATGLDSRGRKQYRYHVDWRKFRDGNKFEHILSFGDALPEIRRRINDDLKKKGLPREKVLAAVVKLLEVTLIRVGNSEYARDNNSYGLTTIRNKHIDIHGAKMTFKFMGKSGKQWNLSVNDRRVAKIAKSCADLEGQELFKYIDEAGEIKDVTSGDVNQYLKEVGGKDSDYTAKDFRTWAGTVLAAIALNEFEKFDSKAEAKKNVVKAIETVSKQLGNTPAICRKCYIHPEILNSYLDGALVKTIQSEIKEEITGDFSHLTPEEVLVLAFLKNKLGK